MNQMIGAQHVRREAYQFLFSQFHFPCSLLFCTQNFVHLDFQHSVAFTSEKKNIKEQVFIPSTVNVRSVKIHGIYGLMEFKSAVIQ